MRPYSLYIVQSPFALQNAKKILIIPNNIALRFQLLSDNLHWV